MSKKTDSGMTVDQVVAQVSANARLEGLELDEETVDIVRKIASGEMTKEDAGAWRKARAEDAGHRFEQATADIAAEGRFAGPDRTEIEIMEEALALQFVDFDPLARYGKDRDLIREKHLISNEITVVLEDKGLRADADLSALLDGPIEDVDIDALRAALERLKAM